MARSTSSAQPLSARLDALTAVPPRSRTGPAPPVLHRLCRAGCPVPGTNRIAAGYGRLRLVTDDTRFLRILRHTHQRRLRGHVRLSDALARRQTPPPARDVDTARLRRHVRRTARGRGRRRRQRRSPRPDIAPPLCSGRFSSCPVVADRRQGHLEWPSERRRWSVRSQHRQVAVRLVHVVVGHVHAGGVTGGALRGRR